MQGGTILLTEGATITSDTLGAGRGGTITMTATDSLTIIGSSHALGTSGLFSSTSGEGAAGKVWVRAGSLTLNGGAISSDAFGDGAAGSVMVEGTEITLSEGAYISSDALGSGIAGSVIVRGGALRLNGQAYISSDAFGGGAAGSVMVRGGALRLNGQAYISSDAFGGGAAGSVMVEGTEITLSEGAYISSDAVGSGTAGSVMVRAETLKMDGAALITSDTYERATGGGVIVEGDEIMLSGGARITSDTFGDGAGGTVTVRARETLTISGEDETGRVSGVFSSATTGSTGNAGTVIVEARTITLSEGGQIASGTRGAGGGGSVIVRSSEFIAINGHTIDESFSSGIFGSVFGSGAGGHVNVLTPILIIDNQGVIGSRSRESSTGNAGSVVVEARMITLRGGAEIISDAAGAVGNGGDVTVRASEALTITGRFSGLISDTSGSGAAGRVTVSTPMLTILDGGAINVGTSAEGRAGSIRVEVDRLTLTGGAFIGSNTTGAGQGGNITVTATDMITITGRDQNGQVSGIVAAAEGQNSDAGSAGRIVIQAPQVTLEEGAQISSSTQGPGQGGTVTIIAENLSLQRGGIITTATSGAGDAGMITVVADSIDINGQGMTSFTGISAETRMAEPVADLRTTLDITHTFDADLHVALISPSGTAITLFNRVGEDGHNFTNTIFDDRATTPIQTGSAPFRGTFRPQDSFSRLIGETVHGPWTLQVTDLGLADQGTLNNWSLEMGSRVLNTPNVPSLISDRATTNSILTIDAPNMRVGTASLPLPTGKAGDLTVRANTLLQIRNNGSLSTSTVGSGVGGNITVTAPMVTMAGGIIQAETQGSGRAGTITLNVGGLNATEQTTITSSSTATAMGAAGSVTVQGLDGIGSAAHMLTLTNSRLLTRAAGDGIGGDILLRANEVALTDGTALSATAGGRGEAGEIRIVDVATLRSRNSTMTTEATTGRGGSIAITAAALIDLTGTAISATVMDGSNPGGDITLTAPVLRLAGGRLEAETRSMGHAGSITLHTDRLDARDAAQITSSSTGIASGNAGTITLGGLNGHDTFAHTVTLTGSTLRSVAEGSGTGGAISISTETLQLAHATLSAAVNNGVDLPGSSRGDITLTAPTVLMIGGKLAAETTGTRNAGNITLHVDSLVATAAARLTSSSTGQASGAAGTVSIQGQGGPNTAASAVTLTESALLTRADAAASGGDIHLAAHIVTLDHAILSAEATTGLGGAITVTAGNALALTGTTVSARVLDGQREGGTVTLRAPSVTMTGGEAQATTAGLGRGGNIVVEADTLRLMSGARLDSSAQKGGQGGTVSVAATSTLLISGQDGTGTRSGLFSQTLSTGNAGRITVIAPRVTLQEQGSISAETLGDGRGGDIVVQAEQLTLASGAQITSGSGIQSGQASQVGTGSGGAVYMSATESVLLTGPATGLLTRTLGAGQGGNITLQAPRVTLAAGATLSAESTGTGNAGNITITTQDRFLSTGGSVVTRATQADGGNITITAPTLVRLRDSALTSDVGGGVTTVGGNITIDPQFVLVQNSRIVANASEGRGGNIRIRAQQVFLADPTSRVDASSTLGIDGEVAIQAPVTSISGSVAPLPQTFARQHDLLRERCAERARVGAVSRLVLGGRDGVPWQPGNWLTSPLEPLPLLHSTEHLRITPERQLEGYAQRLETETWDVACVGPQRTTRPDKP